MHVSGKTLKRCAGGGAIGLVNGLFGGGGGMIAVPLLEGLQGRGAAAHATAIACILPASLLSAVVYLFGGLPLNVFLPVALGVAAGGALGAKLLPALSGRAIDLLFAGLMFLAGVKSLFAWRL